MSQSVYQDHNLNMISGETINLPEYFKGKTVLFVNVATQCGYTGQLSGLEKLYKDHKEKNFVVFGIPSNDFGGQTPETEPEVKKFCETNYGVSFPMSEKLVVKGEQKHDFIKNLLGPEGADIAWNFEKFLVNKEGQLVKRFKSGVKPEDKALVSEIQAQL